MGVAVIIGVPVFTVGFDEAMEVGVGLVLGVGVGELPEPEAVNAGTSPAWTTKSRVKVCRIPVASFQETVIE